MPDQAVVLRHVNLLIPAVPGVVPRITDWRFKTTFTVLDNLVSVASFCCRWDICTRIACTTLAVTNPHFRSIGVRVLQVRVCTAAAAGFPLLMTGPPGVGKTAIVKGINGVLGQNVEVRIEGGRALAMQFMALQPLCALHVAILRAAHQLFVYHHCGFAGGILPSCDGRWQANVSVAQRRAAECPEGGQLSHLDVCVGLIALYERPVVLALKRLKLVRCFRISV